MKKMTPREWSTLAVKCWSMGFTYDDYQDICLRTKRETETMVSLEVYEWICEECNRQMSEDFLPPRVIFEGVMEESFHDSGTVLIGELDPDEEDGKLFFELQSYCDDKDHSEFSSFSGKRIRVTVEVLDVEPQDTDRLLGTDQLRDQRW